MKRMLALTFVSLMGLLCIALAPAVAQLDNRPLYQVWHDPKEDSGRLQLELPLLGYLRNNEYFNNAIEGETRFGYQANPRIAWQVLPKLSLRLGYFVQREFGQTQTWFADKPTWSMTYTQGKHQFIFGTLQGAWRHNLIEPFYAFERGLTRRIEEGAQWTYQDENTFFDAWIDWNRFQNRPASNKESFVHGLNFSKSIPIYPGVNLAFPLQYSVFHQGGQVDTLSDQPAKFINNFTLGLKLDYYLGRDTQGFNKPWKITLEYYPCLARSSQPKATANYRQGFAHFANVSVSRNGWQAMASYWQADDFFSWQGGRIYQSLSSTVRPKSNDPLQDRRLLFLRILKNHTLHPGFEVSGRLEAILDTRINHWDFNMGLYLTAYPSVILHRGKSYGKLRGRKRRPLPTETN